MDMDCEITVGGVAAGCLKETQAAPICAARTKLPKEIIYDIIQKLP